MVVAYSNGGRLPDFGALGGGVVPPPPGVILNKQSFVIDLSFSGTTLDTIITAVNTSNVLMYVSLSEQQDGGNTNNKAAHFTLVNSTTLRATRSGSSSNTSSFIVDLYEIDPTVIVSNQFFSASDTRSGDFTDITLGSSVVIANSIVVPHYYTCGSTLDGFLNVATDLIATNTVRYWAPQSGTQSYDMRGQVMEFI